MAMKTLLLAIPFALNGVSGLPSPDPVASLPSLGSLLSDPYAPSSVPCSVQPQVRPAVSLSPQESTYVASRQAQADQCLSTWLARALGGSGSVQNSTLPRISLALSGGGPKAGLTTAGLVQAFDSRDSTGGVSGLLQSMTYMTALSGGSLTLSGVMANNFARISVLKKELYNINYQNPFLAPLLNDLQIQADVDAKHNAGYRTTPVDSYGRALAFDFIGGFQGANGVTWSGVLEQTSFEQFEAPFPIITLTDTDVLDGQCQPNSTGPVWEFSPYEFGSWNPIVEAFFPTKYLATPVSSGSNNGKCTVGFDNAGFFTGISANTFVLGGSNCTKSGDEKLTGLAEIIALLIPAEIEQSPFGIVPNPFYEDERAGSVRARPDLYMQDGGDTGQVIPLLPLLQPERDVDVIFAIDAESDTSRNIASGSSLYNTGVAAQILGLTTMPTVPTPAIYAAQNLSSRAQFFGCHDPNVTTIIYIPNTEETQYPSSDYFFTYRGLETVFTGGIEMATQMTNTQWPGCVACGILHKTVSDLPTACEACLSEYCWQA